MAAMRNELGQFVKGAEFPAEFRSKMGDSRRGKKRKPHSEETKRKISEAKKGQVPWMKGRHHSDESKRKISEANVGNAPPKTAFKKGHTPWHKGTKGLVKASSGSFKKGHVPAIKGKHHSEITKEKMRQAALVRGGGVSTQNEIKRKSAEFGLWRKAVFARDGWNCQRCRESGGKLHPHHILNFAEHSELQFVADNGITLCESCHKTFHKEYGFGSNNESQLGEFLVWQQ